MSIQASRAVAGIAALAVIVAIFGYMKRDADQAVETPVATSTVSTTSDQNPIGTGTVSQPSSGLKDMIRVSNISANQKVTSPLVIQGEARGNWYFEASFPVKLLDGNGKTIVQMPAQAKGEWMTSDFVPFAVTLTFTKPSTATGTLILHNDNPSGNPENDRYISIPVQFQ